jgi:hypothetical protein
LERVWDPLLNGATNWLECAWEPTYDFLESRILEKSGVHLLRSGPVKLYATGLSSVFLGACFADFTGSMLPLALSGSASLMCTAVLVKAIWTRRL